MNYGFGAADAFDALVYGQSHPGTLQFIQNQVSHVADTLSEAGRAFMSKGQAIFDQMNSSAAMQFARDVMKSVKGVFDTHVIANLWELDHLQGASLTMQRWIMANPVIREKYHNQQLDGFSETYTDNAPGEIGPGHYDYNRVMDGVFEFNKEDGWKSTQYLDRLLDGDRDLLFSEQCDIMNTWLAAEVFLALGKDDPTSSVGGTL